MKAAFGGDGDHFVSLEGRRILCAGAQAGEVYAGFIGD